MDWGFDERGLRTITAIIATANRDSTAVAGRLNMSVLRTDHLFGHSVTVFARRCPDTETTKPCR